MEMREYSLVDFDISSNTLFVLNLQNAASESISEFTTAISSAREIINQPPTSQLPKSHEKTQQQHAPAPIADSNAENSSQSNCPSFNVSISSVSTESARKFQFRVVYLNLSWPAGLFLRAHQRRTETIPRRIQESSKTNSRSTIRLCQLYKDTKHTNSQRTCDAQVCISRQSLYHGNLSNLFNW